MAERVLVETMLVGDTCMVGAKQQVAEAISALGWARAGAAAMQVAQEMLQDVEETMVGARDSDGVWVPILGAVQYMSNGGEVAAGAATKYKAAIGDKWQQRQQLEERWRRQQRRQRWQHARQGSN